jgi:hypothetical protein
MSDPRSASAEELADPQILRDYLAAEFEDSANWRAMKAVEYPDDSRNETSRIALEVAAREVVPLPDDDPRLVRLAMFWQAVASDDEDRILDHYLEEKSRLIGRHGFGRGATQTTSELLAALVALAIDAVRTADDGG